jgi:hypothetical protein
VTAVEVRSHLAPGLLKLPINSLFPGIHARNRVAALIEPIPLSAEISRQAVLSVVFPVHFNPPIPPIGSPTVSISISVQAQTGKFNWKQDDRGAKFVGNNAGQDAGRDSDGLIQQRLVRPQLLLPRSGLASTVVHGARVPRRETSPSRTTKSPAHRRRQPHWVRGSRRPGTVDGAGIDEIRRAK